MWNESICRDEEEVDGIEVIHLHLHVDVDIVDVVVVDDGVALANIG